MTLRTFLSADGMRWSVWYVESKTLRGASGAPRAWLAFLDEHGTERRRLLEVPPNWEAISDEPLDLLRRMAAPAHARDAVAVPTGARYIPPVASPDAAEGQTRALRDPDGVVWQVAAIRPTLAERRAGGDRRQAVRPGTDRRRSAGARVRMPEPFQYGWLVFRSATEHRRRAPIPGGWLTMSEEALRSLLGEAITVDRPRRTG